METLHHQRKQKQQQKQKQDVEDEEQGILAELGSSVAFTSDYESNVLRKATIQLAPKLVPGSAGGFPDELEELLPYKNKSSNGKNVADDVLKKKNNGRILHQVLDRIQSKIEEIVTPTNNNNHANNESDKPNIDQLRFQQQMLLTLLEGDGVLIKQKAMTLLHNRELELEEKYQRFLTGSTGAAVSTKQQQQGAGAGDRNKVRQQQRGIGCNTDLSSRTNRPRPRIPIMKRKQMELFKERQELDNNNRKNGKNNNGKDISNDREQQLWWNQRKKELKKLRQERLEKRRQQWSSDSSDSSSSSEEVEFGDNDVEEEEEEECQKQQPSSIEEERKVCTNSRATDADISTAVTESATSVVPDGVPSNEVSSSTDMVMTDIAAVASAADTTGTATTPIITAIPGDSVTGTTTSNEISGIGTTTTATTGDSSHFVVSSTITCPLCLQTVPILDHDHNSNETKDAILARHMELCQQNTVSSSSRTSRRTRKIVNYSEVDNIDSNDDGDGKRSPQRRSSNRATRKVVNYSEQDKNGDEKETEGILPGGTTVFVKLILPTTEEEEESTTTAAAETDLSKILTAILPTTLPPPIISSSSVTTRSESTATATKTITKKRKLPAQNNNGAKKPKKERKDKSKKRKAKPRRKRQKYLPPVEETFQDAVDDLEEYIYEDRVDDWIEHGIQRMKDMTSVRDTNDVLPGAEEYEGGLYIPEWMNNRLFSYQRIALRWFWELYKQEAGGVMGDEMGLGKTVQVSSFLGVMGASRKLKSVLIVAPATMLQHWLRELATWAPGLRRVLIHSSGEKNQHQQYYTTRRRKASRQLFQSLAGWLRKVRADYVNEPIDEEDVLTMDPSSFIGTGYAVVTTYESIRLHSDVWTEHDWSYVVLDEAQKIRNPDADVTMACKRLRTPNRIAMTGTPIQNDLRELWSLFDFVFPGRLGTLPAFETEFSHPIRRGGYSNASTVQVQVAYRCALVLKDLINPYMLRRQKRDIKEVNKIPSKTEQVLFCRLSKRQRAMYATYLASDDVVKIMKGSLQLLAAITTLRKICNHPDLLLSDDDNDDDDNLNNDDDNAEESSSSFSSSLMKFSRHSRHNNNHRIGNYDNDNHDDEEDDIMEEDDAESLAKRSGKLEVLSKILPLWHKQGHRVIIFSQWTQMLNILQRFVLLKEWKFGRLDGKTSVAARQKLVDTFNGDESYFGLLCTTKTGGVGLNLTGANKIIIYDPDWNPQSDAQARERCYRFGQTRKVTIYRLITAGTVEEKIYQRQIFKTALSNKILQDPKQRRLFSYKDLKDLLSLKDDSGSVRSGKSDGFTETGEITKGAGVVDPDACFDDIDNFHKDITHDDNYDVDGEGEQNNDEEMKNNSNGGDDDVTLKSVLKSKGLAGIFDHDCVEGHSSKKSQSAGEMEKEATKIAQAAADALKQSVANTSMRLHDPYIPTWTGESSYGDGVGPAGAMIGGGATTAPSSSLSSRSLLDSLRQQNAAVKSSAMAVTTSSKTPTSGAETKRYADLMIRIRKFIKEKHTTGGRTTDDILKEFSHIPSHEAAIFKRLLKSVAKKNNRGRWYCT